MQETNEKRESIRLDKLLSNLGYGSRRDMKNFLKSSVVKVDGIVKKDGSIHLNPFVNIVTVNDENINYREFIYIMMNKPKDVISATFDDKLRTVIDILPNEYKCFEPFPVGRLDIDTEGLLIITNDGKLTHDLLSPKKHVSKKYFAKINCKVTNEDISAFKDGVILEDGYKTLSANLEIINSGEISEIILEIFEGKFHQVKRMFEAVGKRVVYLKRLQMGELILDEALKLGECRELTTHELEILRGEGHE